ncbi:MAG: heme exporter protein CcmD [Chloroflexi bacterium]|nr:heme exporter protein CcmD [Chloroflexota bacterium]
MSPDYVIAAYVISLLTLLVYWLWLRRRERALEDEVMSDGRR